jgi:hypothetical protein
VFSSSRFRTDEERKEAIKYVKFDPGIVSPKIIHFHVVNPYTGIQLLYSDDPVCNSTGHRCNQFISLTQFQSELNSNRIISIWNEKSIRTQTFVFEIWNLQFDDDKPSLVSNGDKYYC